MKYEKPFLLVIALAMSFSVSVMGQTPRSIRWGDAAPSAEALIAFVNQKRTAAATNTTHPADQAETLYRNGMRALNDQQWQVAITNFNQLVALHTKSGAEALYWKAYAENKQGLRVDAIATLQDIERSYPGSRWLNDARALELEVRQASGQMVSPKDQPDDQLKLLAINALIISDPGSAIPLLEKMIENNQSIVLKERALFVLTQSESPQARQAVVDIARSNPNPALRNKALDDLALFGGDQNQQLLAQIYASSNDLALKRHILHDFMIARATHRLVEVAKTDKALELREAAIYQLGLAGEKNQLSELYQQEKTESLKKAVLHAMGITQDGKALVQIARTETRPELRVDAINTLGLIRNPQISDALVSLYVSNPDRVTRNAVVDALFIQGNAHALVELAYRETDPEMKKVIVTKLSFMHSPEATDYLLKILNH
jgi:HEAT repeat protein